MKHIDIAYYFVHDYVGSNIQLKYCPFKGYCPSKKMVADIFTIALPRPTFEFYYNWIGLLLLAFEEEC